MKINKYFLNYGYAYLCYYALGNFLIAFLPVVILATSKIRRIKISKTYFTLIIYMIAVSCWSVFNFENINNSNLISSQKVYIFVICYILVYSASLTISTRDLFIFASRFMTLFLPIATLVSLLNPNIHIFGLRGDVGILLCFAHFFSAVDKLLIRKNVSLYLIEFVLLINILQFLQGRTAFGVLAVCLFFFFQVKRQVYNQKSVFDIFAFVGLIVGILTVGIFLFNSRGGIEYVQTSEARTLALFYWYDVMLETSWQKVIFGHGYGTCADHIIGSNIFTRAHVNQILAASGQNCYVSWGFHNTILSLIYELGFLFFFLLIWHINTVRRSLTKEQRVGMWFLIAILIIASPNNHFVNHDILGFVIFSSLAYLERLGARTNVPT